MNNSSANNVLLKSLQSTVQPSVAAKRQNLQEDSIASFQQNLKDAQESVRSTQDKNTKSLSKKAHPSDNAKAVKAPEKRADNPPKVSQKDRDPKAADVASNTSDVKSDAKADEKMSAEGQTTKQEPEKDQAEHPAAAKKAPSAEVEEGAADASLMLSPLVPIVANELPANVAILPEVNVDGSIASINTEVNSLLESDLTQPLALQKVDVPVAVEGALFSTEEQSPVGSNGLVKAVENEPVVVASNITSELDNSLSLQPMVESSNKIAPELTPNAIAPALQSIVGGKALPQQAVSNLSGDPLADVISAVTDSGSEEGSLMNAVGATVSDIAKSLTDTANKDGGNVEQKNSLFEQAFKSLARTELTPKEEFKLVSSGSSQPAATSPSSAGLDSMFRFNDASSPAARSFVVQTAVPVPVGQPQWSQAVGEKVLWLAAQNVSSAEINLNPEHLGPMQVKVSVNQEHTTVNFTSHHAVVREVLDQNLGRLRDMFSEQGLNLVNVDVSDKSFSRQQGEPQDQKGHAAHKDGSSEEEIPVAVSLISQQRLVDHYA